MTTNDSNDTPASDVLLILTDVYMKLVPPSKDERPSKVLREAEAAILSKYISKADVLAAINNVQQSNDSNGRYNACLEIRQALNHTVEDGERLDMAFEAFTPKHVGRSGIGDDISLTAHSISFGKNKPPFEYLVIEYDVKNKMIRFSEGKKHNAYRVFSYKNQCYYYINVWSFMKKGYLPKGRYAKVGENTYQQSPAKP